MTYRRGGDWGQLALLMAAAWCSEARALDSSTGTNVGAAVGATPAYAAGFTGAGAIVANIEAGYVWTGHDATADLAGGMLCFHAPTNDATTGAWTDRHATWVGYEIAGNAGTGASRGIAYGATLWSGAIATSWDHDGTGFSDAFEVGTNDAFFSPYYQASIAGVSVVNGPAGTTSASAGNHGTADVITSSWGYATSDQRELGGDNYFSLTIDALAARSGKLFVFAAGNGGGGATISCPANGCNTLTVGALTGDQTSPAYDAAAPFGSTGPQNVFVPARADGSLGAIVFVARARVDISAPGDDLTLAYYGGTTGGNALGPADGSADDYSTGAYGTSFAAPIVSGAAALLAGAGKERFGDAGDALDGRVLKAVLMNSAAKTAGWTNNATMQAGVLRTTQGVDLNVGAGRVDVAAALANYLGGTTGVPSANGGPVARAGWDLGTISATPDEHDDYLVSAPLRGGTTFTATLCWYADGQLDLAGEAGLYGSFFDLDLQLLEIDAGTERLIAESATRYDASEQVYLTLPDDGLYELRVVQRGAVWNFTGDTDVTYGLAWSAAPIPEFTPSAWGAPLCLALTRRRRRRTSSTAERTARPFDPPDLQAWVLPETSHSGHLSGVARSS